MTIADESGKEYVATVDDVKFVHFAYDSIFIGDGFTALPANIYAARDGDLHVPAATWLSLLAGSHGSISANAGSWAKGMTYSAMCLQDGSISDLATATAIYNTVDTLPSIRDWGIAYYLSEWLSPCEFWEVTSPSTDNAVAPVESDLPTLMLTGHFDPEAAPAISRPAAELLPNSFFFELPSAHGLIVTDCALEIIDQFLAHPGQMPEASCIDEKTFNWLLPE